MAVTDPLPLVPAMCTDRNVRSGMAEAREQRLYVFETELDPELFEAE